MELGKLIHGLTFEQYAEVGGLRASDLKALKKSAAHWKLYKQEPPDSEALRFGKIFHAAIESPEKFRDTYKVKPKFDLRTNAGKEGLKAFQAEHDYADYPILEHNWVEPMTGMLRSALSHKLVGNLLKKGVRETSLFVEDPDTGLILQCRPDYISERGIGVDIKTTRDASDSFFMKEIFGAWGRFYVLSAAHYTHCAKLSGAYRHESFVFIAIEKEAPYGLRIYPLDAGCLDVGERWRQNLTRLFAECKKSDIWPAYPEEAVAVTPPAWADIPENYFVE